MATITLDYNAENSVSQGIINIIISMDNLFKVRNSNVMPKSTTVKDKKQVADEFLHKWAGKFSISEQKTDDERYNYLVEKYK